MAKPYLSPVSFRFLAHRGLTVGEDSQPLDENTQSAFARALQVGANYLEVDVRASRDGVVVVCHDADLVRIADRPQKVAELDWAVLEAIPLRNGGKLMSLEQLLSQYGEARVNIDIKSLDAAEGTAQVVLSQNALDRVLISSFSRKRRLAASKLVPGVATSSSAIELLTVWLAHRLHSKTLMRRVLSGLDALQIPTSRGPLRFDSESFIAAVKSFGVEIHYWTINDPEIAKQLRARGANGVVSDRIDLIVAALAE
jgi:glycerophosphoryl diester phosphodiesterase